MYLPVECEMKTSGQLHLYGGVTFELIFLQVRIVAAKLNHGANKGLPRCDEIVSQRFVHILIDFFVIRLEDRVESRCQVGVEAFSSE
jgi:hypothetical protein